MSAISELKTTSNIMYSCKDHIVWCPKYRRKVLVDEVAVRLEGTIRETAYEEQVEIIAMEITPALPGTCSQGKCVAGASVPDQVDLLWEIHPQYGVADKRTKFQIVAAWPGV